MATHRPGDDPTLELTVPAPAAPLPVDDTVPYPPHAPHAPLPPPAWGAPQPRGNGRGCLVALAIAAGLTVLLVLAAAALLARRPTRRTGNGGARRRTSS